jgi:site-specific recombinase XerD
MPRPRRNPRISLQLPAEAAAFIASLEPILQPNSCRAYAQGLRRLNAFLQSGGLVIGDITRQHIVEWSKDLHREGLSAATRTLALIAARSYFRYLHEAGLLATDARQLVTNSDLPKLPRTLPRSLQPETDRQLCELWESSTRPTWLGLLLLRQTGMRVGELQALPYDCIHEVAHGRRYIKVPVGKLRSERVVPIDDAVMSTVSRLQASRPGKRRWLVPSPSGRQISYRAFQRALRDAVDVLGVTDSQPLTIHRLRHTYGTAMLNAGMSLSVLKEILGHRDIAMTLRYAMPTLENDGTICLVCTQTDDGVDVGIDATRQPEPTRRARSPRQLPIRAASSAGHREATAAHREAIGRARARLLMNSRAALPCGSNKSEPL